MSRRTAIIVCGTLAREVRSILERTNWKADLFALDARHHLRPKNLVRVLDGKLAQLSGRYERLVVVYGDCGTAGAVDEVLCRYGAVRVAGPHCYEMYAGEQFNTLMEKEPGTFFLTDFLVRTFDGTVIRPLGLDRHPELWNDYFAHYRRVVYLAQDDDAQLQSRAQAIAGQLGLPLTVHHTGLGQLTKRLAELRRHYR